MDRERQAKPNAIGGRVHPRRALGPEKLIAIGGAIEIDMVHQEIGCTPSFAMRSICSGLVIVQCSIRFTPVSG